MQFNAIGIKRCDSFFAVWRFFIVKWDFAHQEKAKRCRPAIKSSPSLAFQSAIHLLFDPVSAFWLIGFNIHIVDQGRDISQRVKVSEQLLDIIRDLNLISVHQFESLLVHLTDAIDAFRDVCILHKRLRCLIRRELNKQDGVSLVRDCGLRCRIHSLLVRARALILS